MRSLKKGTRRRSCASTRGCTCSNSSTGRRALSKIWRSLCCPICCARAVTCAASRKRCSSSSRPAAIRAKRRSKALRMRPASRSWSFIRVTASARCKSCRWRRRRAKTSTSSPCAETLTSVSLPSKGFLRASRARPNCCKRASSSLRQTPSTSAASPRRSLIISQPISTSSLPIRSKWETA